MRTLLRCRACQVLGTSSNPLLWEAADHQTVLCAACARWAHLSVPPCPIGMHVYSALRAGWACDGCGAWYVDAAALGLPSGCPSGKHTYVPARGGQWTCATCGQALTSQLLPVVP